MLVLYIIALKACRNKRSYKIWSLPKNAFPENSCDRFKIFEDLMQLNVLIKTKRCIT